MPWTAGQRLQGGKYVINTVLGQGGFGITYKALHVELNRTVVIKTPNEYLSHDPEYDKYIERFIAEGRTLARLSQDPHPHIVGVIDLFREDTTHCLVMHFVPIVVGTSGKELRKFFSKFQTCMILAVISSLGLGLGWLGWWIFNARSLIIK